MIAARSLVVGVVVFHELRGILRHRVDDSSGKRVCAVPVVLGTLGVELTAGLVAGIGIVRASALSAALTARPPQPQIPRMPMRSDKDQWK